MHGPRKGARRLAGPWLALLVGGVVLAATTACSDDGSIGGTGPDSGSLASEDLSGTTDDEAVLAAVDEYRAYLRAEVNALTDDALVFTDAVRAGDLAAAKAAFAPSRVRWERIEPVAGLVPDIDGKVDARVDDFAGPQDPGFTGWHRLEHLLWERGTTEGGKPFADQLDADLADLAEQVQTLDVPPAAVALGAGELVEEVSKGKITGEEDRYSHTDLWDFAANIDGAEKVVEIFAPALEKRDPDLLAEARAGIAAVEDSLEPYREGDGWAPYMSLSAADKATLKAQLAALSETLAQLPSGLGLR